MLSSSNDLGNFTSAAWLGTESGHPRPTIGHHDFFAVLDGAVLFALHAIALDVRHDTHARDSVRILNASVRDSSKGRNIAQKGGGRRVKTAPKWKL